MEASYHRHDISDEVWALLEPHYRDNAVSGEGSPRITAVLSMRCSGYCGPEHPGETCLLITESGEASISGSSAGAEKGLGKTFWRF